MRNFTPRRSDHPTVTAVHFVSGIHIRGHRKDYDGWRDDGCVGWGYDDVLPYFKRAENFAEGAGPYRGAGGPLHVRPIASPHAVSGDFVAACAAAQIPQNTDFNGADLYGAGFYDVTQFHSGKTGERCSAAAAYLDGVRDRPNLHVLTNARAMRVVIDDRRANGVELSVRGKRQIVHTRGEVILSAGAFQSPQLLMLSGIGPGAELLKHGIPVQMDAPAVGQNLQDHLDFILSYGVNTPEVFGLGPRALIRLWRGARQWRRGGSGIVSSNFAEAGAFFSVGADGPAWPDTQLHFTAARIENHARSLHWGYGISCHVCVLRPESRGSVTLACADPMAAPRIDPRYLSDDADLGRLMAGIRKAHAIMSSQPLAQRITVSHTLKGSEDDRALEQLMRNCADTIYHPVGTCRMGSDPGSVVDERLSVRGIAGLRVADASIMPRIVSGNTNAPTIMIGEKGADLVRAR